MSIVTRNSVIVSKSFAITYDSIKEYPLRKQILILYKKLYRLRLFREDHHATINYKVYLRRKFLLEDFNLNRKVFSTGLEPLSSEDLIKRGINTLAFIQNASTRPEKSPPSNIESKILKTILKMEYSMPNEIKYDKSFKWVDNLTQASQIAKVDVISGEFNKKKHKKSETVLSYIGYQDYQRNLIGLNEHYGLCL